MSEKLYHFPALDCTKFNCRLHLKITVRSIIFLSFSQVRHANPRDSSVRYSPFVSHQRISRLYLSGGLAARVADETHCDSSLAII